MQRHLSTLTLILSLFICSPALAWHDATHMAVIKAAGLDNYAYLAVGPDMTKEKSGGYEEGNHYRGNAKGVIVTAAMALDQVRDYNCRCNDEGHLYGAIIAALDQYRERKSTKGKQARYPLGFAGHYIGDLSMPLHNVAYNDFNRAYHSANDGAVEGDENEPTDTKVARIAAGIREKMKLLPPYKFPSAKDDPAKFNLELAKKIAEIANKAMALGYAMQEANPPKTVMSSDEAYGQLAESAALLKAAFAAVQ
jgi:hypothetical protein